MSLSTFQLLRPKTLDEAVEVLSRHAGEVKVIAGGTDLLPSMNSSVSGVAKHGHAGGQHLSGYALSLVQPVVAVAEELRVLPQEGRRPLPCCAGRKDLLGGLFGRYGSRAAMSRGRD
jgi:hypothetical protein